jgi:hypothetical protein
MYIQAYYYDYLILFDSFHVITSKQRFTYTILENQGYWYINDRAYRAQREQGNTLQRPFVEHLPLLLRRDSLPVIN